MAGLGGNSLYISPDTLSIDGSRMNVDAYQGENLHQPQQYHHHHTNNATNGEQQPQRFVSFANRQRLSLPNLNLPMHTFSEWNVPTQNSFRPQLPPTPNEPFRPLRTLTEEDKMAFPCPGGPNGQDCWNPELCPKHRQYPDTPPKQDTENPQANSGNTVPTRGPNPRTRSAPTDLSESSSEGHDSGPTSKLKRHATDPDEHDPTCSSSTGRRPSHHRTISRDTRTSLSRGRVPHNLVERRYRDNLNHQIESLRLVLPSLRDAQPPLASSGADLSDLDTSSPRMPSKAIIISTAATYIRDMENERARLLDANKALLEQVANLQKLLRCDEGNLLQYINAMRLTAGQVVTPM